MLLRQGVFLLATLCLNDRLFVEHRVDVEHQYINVVSSVTRLYTRITGLISEAEGECPSLASHCNSHALYRTYFCIPHRYVPPEKVTH